MATQTAKTPDPITRAKAERELRNGADPTLPIYTNHVNKHVKERAAKMAAKLTAAAAAT